MKSAMNRKLIRPKDLFLIGILLAAAVGGYFLFQPGDGPGQQVQITLRGYAPIYVDLSTDQVLTLPQIPQVVFQVEDGAISFAQSDCPDQVCIRMGPQNRVGQSAACLPNRVSLVIIGEPDEIDLFM